MGPLGLYVRWLHTRWPAGTVERLPQIHEGGRTALPGVRIVGDLTGVPLLKLASDSGARAVQAILAEPDFARRPETPTGVLDLAIVGGGVAGIAAAIEAKKAGLRFQVFEAERPFSTIANFPKAKPIYTYPSGMTPAGDLPFRSEVHPKEALLEGLEAARRNAGIEPTVAQIDRLERREGLLVLRDAEGGVAARALRVIVAIGRSGSHRTLGVPGEQLDKVSNRLYDPKDFAGRRALVVGGGDSALETAIALSTSGAQVVLSYRRKDFARSKPENIRLIRLLERDADIPVGVENPSSERVTSASGIYLWPDGAHRAGTLRLAMATKVVRIGQDDVTLEDDAGRQTALGNDVVFTMLGREAPLDFFRRSGIPIRGEWTARSAAAFAAFFLVCALLCIWKAGGAAGQFLQARGVFPAGVPAWIAGLGAGAAAASRDPRTWLGTLTIAAKDPGFFYSIAYCVLVLVFGIRRIRRRKTPYVTLQTVTLTLIQWIPLFLLPYLILPHLGHNGAFDSGFGRTLADNLFPVADAGQGREYWRAFGLILAWPLFVWNVFASKPLTWWLVISVIQTFVILPLAIRRWGKGVYCGWICSCGALAETLGDAHRQKMPHGPIANRLNLLGQAILGLALLLFAGRAVSWVWPATRLGRAAERLYAGLLYGWHPLGIELNYAHTVDLFLAGIVGLGTYFWFSGRVWCRFACPLAALMHIYTRFSRFRIFPEKARCISCNLCTSVCHQGVDVMSFANKGLPMEDPECVRCSACVEVCPTGTLQFGRLAGSLPVYDKVWASPVLEKESRRP